MGIPVDRYSGRLQTVADTNGEAILAYDAPISEVSVHQSRRDRRQRWFARGSTALASISGWGPSYS